MPSRPEPARRPRRRPALRGAGRLLAAGLALALAGCLTTYDRETVYERGDVTVKLRSRSRGGDGERPGFSHPATIAGIRIAHILARIDVRASTSGLLQQKGEERKPAVSAELLYSIGEGVSVALARANPEQEVVVEAVRTRRNLKLFTEEYYTSFLAWVRGDQLFLHFGRADDLISKGEEVDDIREPFADEESNRFKVLPAQAMTPLGRQTLAVDWRNATFRRASHIKFDAQGNVTRRQVLMESSPVAEDVSPEAEVPATLPVPQDPDALRALVEIEEARRNGEITEHEYQRARRRILLESAEEAGVE